ncbi:MAG TPA: hypothetical protein DDZ80_15875 [Cyanobacteria bacterium UBA8803]|nr:hypothetical protein [Cyanobacteria bacterium UBA8803]
MSAASRYWTFIRIAVHHGCKTEEIQEAKAFFQKQFPEFTSGQDVPELVIQRKLLQTIRGEEPDGDSSQSTLAQLCLRCFISKQIEQACIQIEAKFGSNHGFTRYDLFPFVLTDVDVIEKSASRRDNQASTYATLATEILQTFDPERGSLTTWTNRLVKQHRELKTFLLEQGVYLVSDWAILNDTTPEQLSRIFSEFHHLTVEEIQQASILLESYHAIYRRARLASVRTRSKGQCQLPTTEQLQQIAQRFHHKTNQMLPTEEVMERLQALADLLRQYRLYVRRGFLPTQSLDDPTLNVQADYQIDKYSSDSDDLEKLQREFLDVYRQQFIDCLDQATKEAIADRLTYLQRKKSDKSQQFITALHLFHCQGKAMGEIAPLIGLQAQYQVSRLLKLKQLRTDIQQKMFKSVLAGIVEQVKTLVDSEQFPAFNQQQVEVALDEEIAKIIQEAEIEAEINTNRNTPLKSLVSRRICRTLERQGQ